MNKMVLSQDNARRWKACIKFQQLMFALACLAITAIAVVIYLIIS